MPPRKRLGQLLTELKVIDETQLQSALGHQKQWGGKIGAIVVEKGFCSEDQLVAVLSQHLGIPTVKLTASAVDPRAVKVVSRSVAERLHVFAYEVVGAGRSEVVTVAMSDPTDLSAVDQLAFHTGKRIKAVLASDSEILDAIAQHYPESSKSQGKATGANLRPAAVPPPLGHERPAPLRVAPPPPTPASAESLRRAEVSRPLPYIPPPVPQNAKPAERNLEEIEPELPVEAGNGAVVTRSERQIEDRPFPPDTEPIEPGPMPREPMALETPTNLQGWAEGPPKAGIEWTGGPTPVSVPPVGAGAPEERPAGGMRAADVEPHREAPTDEQPQAAEAAPAGWGAQEQPQAAEAAPVGWGAQEQPQAAEAAPAGWAAQEQPQAAEAAPAEWGAQEQPEAPEAAPAEWGAEEQPEAAEAAPAEWGGQEQPQAAEAAPAEWGGQEQPQAAEAAPAEWGGQEQPQAAEAAPAEWGAREQPQGGEAPPREWVDQEQPQAAEAGPAEWSAQQQQQSTGAAAAEWGAEEHPARAEEAPAEWGAQDQPPVVEEAPAVWQSAQEQPQAAGVVPAEGQGGQEPVHPAEEAPAGWQAAEAQPPLAEEVSPHWQGGEETAPTASPGAVVEGQEAPAAWGEDAAEKPEWSADQRAEAQDHPGEWSGAAETANAEAVVVPETSSDWGGAGALSDQQREWSTQEPRVPAEEMGASTTEAHAHPPDVPQDAWEDEPVEDATETAAHWSARQAPAQTASILEGAEEEAREPVALPGPKLAPMGAFAESSALEEGPSEEPSAAEGGEEYVESEQYVEMVPPAHEGAAEVQESTDRFDQSFGREGTEQEWPPAPSTDAAQEEWLATPEPLAAADLETLASVGIDPSDGAGAMRTLACLVRVLSRRQVMDLDELAAEIRESRAAGQTITEPQAGAGGEVSDSMAGPQD